VGSKPGGGHHPSWQRRDRADPHRLDTADPGTGAVARRLPRLP